MIRILTESEEYALSSTDAMTLVKLDDGERLDFYFDVVELLRQKVSHEQFVQAKGGRAASNW